MQRYIGIDVHTASCTLAVMGPSGRRITERVVDTSEVALRQAVKDIAGDKWVVFEEGKHSDWLYEVLEPVVKELIVVQPRGSWGTKNDSKDAWDLAQGVRTGTLERVVYKAPRRFAELRAAVRAQCLVTQDVTRCKLRLRAQFIARGVKLQGRCLYTEANREALLEQLPTPQRCLTQVLYEELDGLQEVLQDTEEWLHRVAHKTDAVRRLSTIPGIAEIRAAQIVATVVSPHRFRTRQQFWAYCGLGIVTRSSSDWVRGSAGWQRREVQQTRGLNRNHNRLMKNVFVGAALATTRRMRPNPLQTQYEGLLKKGTKPNLARLTIARRIATIALTLWKREEEYRPDKVTTNAAA